MDKNEIITRLAEIFDDCGWDTDIDITKVEDGIFEQLGLTSVEALEYLFLVENEYDITIDDEDLNASLVTSLAVLADYIMKKVEN